MKVGTFRALCVAAVASALAVPAMAQNDTPTAEGTIRQSPNGARGAAGEADTVRPNVGQAQPGRPGATLRPTAPAAGTIVEEQDNLQPGTRTANFPPQTDRQAHGRHGQGQLGDAALVRWISADNESEIRISEAAQQKAQNQQVKQFAQMMVDEHTKLGQQLQQAANQGGQDLQRGTNTIEERTPNRRNVRENLPDANESRRDPNSRPNDNATDDNNVAFQQEEDPNNRENQARLRNAARNAELQNDAAAGGQMRRGSNPGVELHVQIKEASTQSFLQELQSKNGAEFDKCYLGQQIMAHQHMIDTIKVANQQASPELKQTLQQAQQASQQHLQKAKDLMKQVENERQ